MSAYENMGPFAEEDTNGHLETYTGILGADMDRIYEIVGEGENGEPGWSAAFDLERVPTAALPWLAQFVGVTITPGMTDQQARDAIRAPSNYTVGTIAAIKAAAQRTLTGTKRVIIRERTPTATDLYIRTIASETPDEAVVLKDIMAQKPWHLVLNFDSATGLTYIDVAANYATYNALAATGMTYQELSEVLP